MLRRIAFGLALALLVAVPAAAQNYEKGLAAAERGDYATAHKELRPLAQNGHAAAQYLLAKLYQYGRGVPQDYTEAIKWYSKIAQRDSATHDLKESPDPLRDDNQYFFGNEAQYWLGLMYFNGQGAQRDFVLAYMWFSLSAANGDKMAIKERDIVGKQMTPTQIAKAKKLAWSMATGAKRTFFDPVGRSSRCEMFNSTILKLLRLKKAGNIFVAEEGEVKFI